MERATIMQSTRLGSFAEAWDTLVAQAPLPSPFLRSWWLEHAPRTRALFLLIVEGGQLVGGLALDEDRVWGVPRLQCLGAGALAPDHLDLIAQPGREDEVVAVLRRWLRRPGSRLVDLSGIVPDSRVRAALPGPVHVEQEDVAPFAVLPHDESALMAARSSRVRNTVRRTTKRLVAAGATYRVAEAGETDRALVDLRRLHDERWATRSKFLAAFDAFSAAARCGAARGEVVFHELVADDEVIACEVGFEVAGRASFYQSGRSTADVWRGAGTMLRAAVVARACRNGLTEYDLLRGDETYKQDWADGQRPLLRLRAASGPGATALLVAALARDGLRPVVRRVRARRGAGTTG